MKKVPEIFVNKLKKNISNNKEVYYSYNDDNVYEEEIIPNEYDLHLLCQFVKWIGKFFLFIIFFGIFFNWH